MIPFTVNSLFVHYLGIAPIRNAIPEPQFHTCQIRSGAKCFLGPFDMATFYGSTSDKKERVWTSITSLESEPEDANPFADLKVADYYRELYETTQYECRHVFDPLYEWSQFEEHQVIKILDFRVALMACIMFAGLQIDRGNLDQAISDNFLDDLGLSIANYNMGNTIFLVCFILAELPSQLLSKKFGPDIFVPTQMVAWSIVAISQSAITGKWTFYLTRGAIGALEGGFVAELVLWLSYFYKSSELPIRLSWFWSTISLVQIATHVMAYFLLRLRGCFGIDGWRWLFAVEGLITLAIGLASYNIMVPLAVQTATAFSPHGWFTEKQEKIVVNRVLRDDPSKGDMNNRELLTLEAIVQSLLDYDLWPIYAIGLMAFIPTAAVGKYLALTLRNMGFSTFSTNLLAIPHQILHAVFLLWVTKLSETIDQKAFLGLVVPLWTVPLVGILAFWKDSMTNAWGTWLVTSLLLGGPYIHAICVAWVSRNANSIRSRTVGSAMYNMMVQIGGVLSANIYSQDDAPLFRQGNKKLFIIAIALIPVLVFTKVYYIARNNQKSQKWSSMSPEERDHYIRTTTDSGNKRLDFQFSH